MIDYDRINNTLGKMAYHLATHESICVGVSGGSDSNVIVHMIATYFREYLPKIHFVFQNTGLEYRATLRHLDWMEKHYGIRIDRIKGESVVTVVRREGVPILSKNFSHTVPQAQRNAPSAWEKILGNKTYKDGRPSSFNFTRTQRELALYLIENGIKVSDKCCDISKKKPYQQYLKKIQADLTISGERRCEGGARSLRHKDCFEADKVCDKYMPLFLWSDETKQYYKEAEGIRYSDCYEVWGMKRTGCVGCPFNSRAGEDLKLMQKYEPNMYKACIAVFGESYKLMDQFGVHRHKILEETPGADQPEKEEIRMDDKEYKEMQAALSSHLVDRGRHSQFVYGLEYAKSVIHGIHEKHKSAGPDWAPDFDWKHGRSLK